MNHNRSTSTGQTPGALRPDWPWRDVVYHLAVRRLTVTDVGRRMSPPVTQGAMCMVAIRPNPRVQAAIAAAIGLSPLAIWPSRYDPATGQPVRRTDWLRARGRDCNGAPLRETAA